MKSLTSIYIFFFSFNLIFAQHGFNQNWNEKVRIPLFNTNSKQRGFLYNNMVSTSTGRIIISTAELSKNNINISLGMYLNYSDDNGKTWLSKPIRFSPADLVVGANSLKLAIDNNDNVYAIWHSIKPAAVYLTRMNKDLTILTDTIRIVTMTNKKISATNFTIDKYNRLHLMWNEGETNSKSIAEAFYSRSTDGGLTWQPKTLLSKDDNHHSAFPHAQFDTAGDTLAIPWRDSVATNNWDIYMSLSTNGGKTWSSEPVKVLTTQNTEWDPDLIIDNQNRLHLFYTVYPKTDMFSGARNYYIYSDDIGKSWKNPDNPSNGIISDNFRSQLLEGTRYDSKRNILYTTWKDERDFDFSNGNVRGDLMINYSFDRGKTWNGPEFITDLGDSTTGFKAGCLLLDGSYAINYEIIYPEDVNDPNTFIGVYFSKRNIVLTEIEQPQSLPSEFTLYQNYPNPFNPITTIRYSIPSVMVRQAHHDNVTLSSSKSDREVNLKVYDILGREVATLVNEKQSPGNYEVKFDANNLPSGIYFYKLQAGNFISTKKLIFLK